MSRSLSIGFVVAIASCAEAPRVVEFVPPQTDDPAVVAITAGAEHTCALDDAGVAWCWGANTNGELGDGSRLDRPGPVRVGIPGPLTEVSAGTRHSCGIQPGGIALCWGDNSFGQLGRDGTTAPAPGGVLGLPPVVGIAAGTQHTCAWTDDGRAYCWGGNTFGQLGDGTTTPRSTPAEVDSEMSFTDVVTGLFSTCGVTDDLVAFCWGDNRSGLVRGQPDEFALSPFEIETGYAATSVTLGQEHACLRTPTGDVHCWGDNTAGQLGSGDTEPQEELIEPLPSLAYVSVASGPRSVHSCAISLEVRAYCWGLNDAGQISYPSTAFGIAPALLVRAILLTQATVGRTHSCALATTQEVYCWGDNRRGQLGRGPDVTLTTFPTPAPVVWPER